MLKSIIIAVVCLCFGLSTGYLSQGGARAEAKFWEEQSCRWQENAHKALILNDTLQKENSTILAMADSLEKNYDKLAGATIGLIVSLKKKYPELRVKNKE